jgi:hypothetical protein
MAITKITLIGKSDTKYAASLEYSDAGGSLGCHSKIIAGISVNVKGASWEIGDDIRANKDNWKVVYDALAQQCAGVSHVVMSDNYATAGPRDVYRQQIVKLGYTDRRQDMYSEKIWRTSEVMQILEAMAPVYGHSMTCSPTSGNPVHTGPEGYSACVSGVWVKPSTPAVVWAPTMKEFWEKVRTLASRAGGYAYAERPTSDPASLSQDPVKAQKELEVVAAKVANIWGE